MPPRTIIAFGHFDLDGARSWVIRTGLAEAGYHIRLCRTEAPGLLGKYRDLLRRWKDASQNAAAIYVVFLGHYLMPLAWWLGKRAGIPVVFDAFISLHDTEVSDRARVSRWSPRAWILWMADWISCALADVILLDTEEHKRYFTVRYGVRPEKILVLPVGCRSDLFLPAPASPSAGPRGPFCVEFHGTYIPLQGIDVILAAARRLQEQKENVSFTLVGRGQLYGKMIAYAAKWNLQNVSFSPSVPIQQLPPFIQAADICLGIFGTTPKAGRVIPNKAYEVISCGKPLITARTAAAERVFRDREDAFLIPAGDPAALADAILQLKSDRDLRQRIAEGGLALSRRRFMPQQITGGLAQWLVARL